MIYEEVFRNNIIENSSVPFVAAEDGFWINSEGKNISISDMPTRYLKNCLRTLNNSNSWNEVTSLKNFMDGKITSDNKSVFVEYLDTLIESKTKEVETELERR
ncbi:hypothetical protein JZO66_06360 [Enterococcus sp. DIV0242_7C1]|uniref:Uncharacterized protein n=1 Tax=Candidatus Enterococcus dunnyi TaxID=1834192 RepID=A0A200J246_9ENTE|nr:MULTISPECIES: hypothetical protein [unclassified Enterococcus]MBO0470160.1 hypothetical protein [Enterococcus sp. DIV0242_7C1]OUZ30615.1 hypothetical protein A5889_002903 [Enterococcus sp. 9D6_DIV0238]